MKNRTALFFAASLLFTNLFIACKKEINVKNFHSEDFGENIFFFTPQDDPKSVKAVLEDIYKRQESAQFGEERYALYFMPGTYSPEIKVQVGFYMHVAGLGKNPTDTKIAKLDSLARWLNNRPGNNNACCNFWREAENLEIMSDTVWAVSQATSLRRVKINGNLYLHDDRGWCSGGFSADSIITGVKDSGSQQQWLSRNNEYKNWKSSNWNIVMMGDKRENALEGSWPEIAYTDIEKTPLVREKPFLMFDEKKGLGVFLPDFKYNTKGAGWADGSKGKFIPIENFYIAKPGDSAAKINGELNEGKHLFFTPGNYEISEAICVEKENTIVLGTGLATLIPVNGNECMKVADEDGIVIAGLLFDAGEKKSQNLLLIGKEGSDKSHEKNPVTLSDLYFRVGGKETEKPVKVETCITINSSNVVCDNFWIWRADHGAKVGWDLNEADYGIIVNGNDVTAYALMVEHFKKHETLWNGNRGKIYMYQCEIPYDVPSQEVWKSHNNSKNGYSSICVSPSVTDFDAKGLGIYLLNRKASVTLESPVEVPDAPGVKIENICTVMIGGNPGMSHIVNDKGNPVLKGVSREVLTEYCNGEAR